MYIISSIQVIHTSEKMQMFVTEMSHISKQKSLVKTVAGIFFDIACKDPTCSNYTVKLLLVKHNYAFLH